MALLRTCLWLVCLGFVGLAGPAFAQVDGVRVVGDGEITRVTIWTSSALEADVFPAVNGSQPQVLVSFDGARDVSGPQASVSSRTGVASYGWQRGFLAFTLVRPMMVARTLYLPPSGEESRNRIVIDLAAVSDVRFNRAAERAGPGVAAQTALHVAASDPFGAQMQTVATAPVGNDVALAPIGAKDNYLIVIDPGHGGHDPGAIAASGLQEKQVVLAAAHILKTLLEADDRFTVRLTRSDDRFIPLEGRVGLARDWGADLFISIHADAAANRDVTGASVYTISARGEARIDREAEKNDWHMPIEDGVSEDVSGILTDLLKRETKTNSGVFAELLLPELEAAGPVVRNTHRNAGFYVLLAPDVPAVLLEMGFLTNTQDAARLADANGRRRSMQAVARAISTYFDRQDVILASTG